LPVCGSVPSASCWRIFSAAAFSMRFLLGCARCKRRFAGWKRYCKYIQYRSSNAAIASGCTNAPAIVLGPAGNAHNLMWPHDCATTTAGGCGAVADAVA
jgi:hypothetical protein